MSPSRATRLTHADAKGKARMVDVGSKRVTSRRAVAEALVWLPAEAFRAVEANSLAKGDALGTARLAAILAAKRTGELIPLCHPLALDHVDVAFSMERASSQLRILATARTRARTGVEMEALVAAATAALTVYDMAKGVSKGIVVRQVRLLEKSGGKSGSWSAGASQAGEDEPLRVDPERPAKSPAPRGRDLDVARAVAPGRPSRRSLRGGATSRSSRSSRPSSPSRAARPSSRR